MSKMRNVKKNQAPLALSTAVIPFAGIHSKAVQGCGGGGRTWIVNHC